MIQHMGIKPLKFQAGTYRPDIDGLRAVAVLAVILFHIDPHWLPGGFVGVDIFFVISGYLITGILSNELLDGCFTLKTFYERRIRRILPALWALLLVCLPMSWWLMLPIDAEAMAKSTLWSIIAMANIYFWREVTTDYFAPQSALMPLLHLWSLGVEEQFYVLWPLALMTLWKFVPHRARTLAIVLSVLMVFCSTLLAEYYIATQKTRFAYYMLPARAGELAAGAALSLAWPKFAGRFHYSVIFSHCSAALAWCLLAASFLFLSEDQPFPGYRSLLPILSAILFIAAGHVSNRNIWLRPLCTPASLWLGRCSYSAYLWHWPVLAWWRYLWGQPSFAEGLTLLIWVLLIAGVSQHWIEAPARRARMSWKRTLCLYFLLPAAVLGIISLLMARGEQWGIALYPKNQLEGWDSLKGNMQPVHRLNWVCQRHILDSKTLTNPLCEFGVEGAKPAEIMLLGDSHAGHFAPLIRYAAEIQGVRVRSVALGSCATLPGSLMGVVSENRLSACEEGMRQILARAEDFPLLIIGGAWKDYARRDPRVWNRLEEYLESLTKRGHKIWLLPHVAELAGYDAECPAKRLRVGNWLQCPTILPQTEPNNTTNFRLAQIAERVPNVRFLAMQPVLCNKSSCKVIDNEGRPLYSDASHLSLHGAQQLATELEQQGLLPDLRNF